MKMVRKAVELVALVLLATTFQAKAQDTTIVTRFNALFAEQNDRVKDSIAERIIPDFTSFLKDNSAKNFDFKRIKHLGMIESPDNAFTFYLFNLRYKDGTFMHFGFLQQPNGAGFKVTRLVDKREEVVKPNDEILTPEKWYGALYYQIIPTKSNGKNYYTLLGTSFNDLFTSRKVIEVMEITDGGVVFGAPIFFDGKRNASRVIFEHSARYLMTLRYMPEQKAIVFDHLAPSEPNAANDLQFYGPDGSQDGFILGDGIWTLKQNLDVRMPDRKRKKDFKKIKTY
ncbi:hypothetical protein [uncultured Acetobacteroides sp.]|uniref:hypothetical protein n=1 Tax=uncultured Acetobacteroides sp. TaxID=1760811 RepID=UPI0029F58E52|nr:hypothetical protein [uncultured Acetobacteroides sp.]